MSLGLMGSYAPSGLALSGWHPTAYAVGYIVFAAPQLVPGAINVRAARPKPIQTNSLTASPLPAKLQGSKDIGTAFRAVPSTSVDKLGPGSNRRNFRVRRSIYTSSQSISRTTHKN